MDKETLKTTIINHAKRNYFNGRGRIDLKEFMETFNITLKDIKEALEDMNMKHRFYPPTEEPTLLLIYFGKENGLG